MYDAGAPIYLQIVDHIRRQILAGEWQPGEKFPAVRDLALQNGVNPNTMQKAMALLEEEGLLHAERTSGRYVTTDEAILAHVKRTVTGAEIGRFLNAMNAIGYKNEEIPGLLSEYMRKG